MLNYFTFLLSFMEKKIGMVISSFSNLKSGKNVLMIIIKFLYSAIFIMLSFCHCHDIHLHSTLNMNQRTHLPHSFNTLQLKKFTYIFYSLHDNASNRQAHNLLQERQIVLDSDIDEKYGLGSNLSSPTNLPSGLGQLNFSVPQGFFFFNLHNEDNRAHFIVLLYRLAN